MLNECETSHGAFSAYMPAIPRSAAESGWRRCPLSPCYWVGFGRLIRRVAEHPEFASPVLEELKIRENLQLINDAERLAGPGSDMSRRFGRAARVASTTYNRV